MRKVNEFRQHPKSTSLFNDWKRHNNGDAGQQLAQRVADWYYAIATSFAGERQGPKSRTKPALNSAAVSVGSPTMTSSFLGLTRC